MKKFTRLTAVAMAAAMSIALFSCDDETVRTSSGTLTVVLPDNANIPQERTTTVTFINKSSLEEKTFEIGEAGWTLNLEDGLYDVTVTVTYKRDGATETLRDKLTDQEVSGGSFEIRLEPKRIGTSDIVIEQICVASPLAEGLTTYRGDAWFRITNNGDATIYADSLCIFESEFKTTQPRDYTPDIRNEAMAVCAIYRIPGNGKDYPIAPGGSLLIADVAKNHRTNGNAASCDLSGADFEWFDDTPKANDTDTEVPNLERIYAKTNTVWVPYTQGITAFGIAKIPAGVTDEEFVTDYTYTAKYTIVTPTITKEMTLGPVQKIPNGWILDVVTLAPSTGETWAICSSALDAKPFSLGEKSTAADTRGKVAQRKRDTNGRLIDTNCSADDFEIAMTSDLEIYK